MTYMPNNTLSCKNTFKKAKCLDFGLKMPTWQPWSRLSLNDSTQVAINDSRLDQSNFCKISNHLIDKPSSISVMIG